MSAFQILTRDKQPGDDAAGPDIVSYPLPSTAEPAKARNTSPRGSHESLNLPQVVLRLPGLAGTSRKFPKIRFDLVRTHASSIVLVLGFLFALWLIFGGKRPADHAPKDEAPAWTAPRPAKLPQFESAAPASTMPPAQMPAANPRETNAAPLPSAAPPARAFEAAPIENHEAGPPQLPPPSQPAPQDGTARAIPTDVRTANRPEDTRWDGNNHTAPGEAAPLGIGTGVPQ